MPARHFCSNRQPGQSIASRMAATVASVRLPLNVSSSPSAASAARISTIAFCTIGECAISSSVRSNARRIAPSSQGGMPRNASIRSAVRLVQVGTTPSSHRS